MKKQILTLSFALSSAIALNAQVNLQIGSNQKWSQNGDAVSDGAFAGTTNAKPYILKANNNTGIKINPNGDVVFKPLDLNSTTGPNGLVLTDGQGKIYRVSFPNDATKVLLGNGTFGNIPTTGLWSASGNNLYWNTGSVGIGMVPGGSFKLEVQGDARVSHDLFINNNLYVGGGVVISDKIQAVTQIKGWDFKVDNDLDVTGSTRFSGATRLDQGFTFDGAKGIKFIPKVGGGGTFRYGNNNDIFQPLGVPCAASPQGFTLNHQFGGLVQVYETDATGAYVPGSGMLNMQSWSYPTPVNGITGGSSIDASIGGNTGSGGLLLNYFCGNDVAICTGANGGNIAMGKVVNIGGAYPLTTSTALDIRANGTTGLAIEDINAREFFNVASTGKTTITANSTDAFDIVDPTTGTVNYRVKTNGVAFAREINVQLGNYPDYVFAKNYNLMPIDELAKFIANNHHLPNVPSAKEVETNGANLGELNKIQMEKIEELTLYIIEMKKELEALKKQVNNSK